MRILCFGDLHLGAGTDFGKELYGIDSRLNDQRQVLRRIVDTAIDESVELVLFTGDAFHRRRPTPSEILVWREFLEDLNLPVIAIDGNHDVETADRPSALETVKTSADYEVSRRPQVFYPHRSLAVTTLPWTPPARLVASMNGSVARDEVNDVAAQLLLEAVPKIEWRSGLRERPTNILLLHWSVSGATLPNGIPTDMLREPVLPFSGLADLGFDFIVAGHIHRAQSLAFDFQQRPQPEEQRRGGHLFYTGSPACVDFGEAVVPHGVTILDTDEGESRLVPIEDRRFVTVDCDLTTPEAQEPRPLAEWTDETDEIASAIAAELRPAEISDLGAMRSGLEGAIVRIRYKATPEQARRVDVTALKKLCYDSGAHKVYSVQAEIVRGERARVEGLDEQMGTLEALHEWTKAVELEPNPAERLGELTVDYLQKVRA